MKINCNILKASGLIILGILLGIGGVDAYVIWAHVNQHADTVALSPYMASHPCEYTSLQMLVGYNTAGGMLSEQQQRTCSLEALPEAKPIPITATMVGDVPLSAIRLYASDGDILSGTDLLSEKTLECANDAVDAPSEEACFLTLDSELRGTMRSLIATILGHMETVARTAAPVDVEKAETDWPAWYVNENYTGNLTAATCDMETLPDWMASSSGIGEVTGECVIKYDAREILWLVDQYNEIGVWGKQGFP